MIKEVLAEINNLCLCLQLSIEIFSHENYFAGISILKSNFHLLSTKTFAVKDKREKPYSGANKKCDSVPILSILNLPADQSTNSMEQPSPKFWRRLQWFLLRSLEPFLENFQKWFFWGKLYLCLIFEFDANWRKKTWKSTKLKRYFYDPRLVVWFDNRIWVGFLRLPFSKNCESK